MSVTALQITVRDEPELRDTGYFDGSHLRDDAAIKFTKDLCRQRVRMDDEIKGEESQGK